jgi:hypothetical protein
MQTERAAAFPHAGPNKTYVDRRPGSNFVRSIPAIRQISCVFGKIRGAGWRHRPVGFRIAVENRCAAARNDKVFPLTLEVRPVPKF